jgi:hypothetical protein|tara:strand:- start:575 stop:730 length:156 start_codon:yes stop_codon:yes gene_type:complete
MPKKNYTQAGAKRAVLAMRSKLHKLFSDGYMSVKVFVNIDESLNRLTKGMK